MTLFGEGEYNLNSLIEIEVSESYLGLSKEVRDCQNWEPFYNCTTRHYRENFLMQCDCLPLNIRLSYKVQLERKHF